MTRGTIPVDDHEWLAFKLLGVPNKPAIEGLARWLRRRPTILREVQRTQRRAQRSLRKVWKK